MAPPSRLSRRQFLLISGAALAAGPLRADEAEPVFDIHQHTKYLARTDEDLLAHQRKMGVTKTLLLPAGVPVSRASTHDGKSNGLAAGCGGNETVVAIARAQPDAYYFGANEVTDLENAPSEIERYLKMGAKIVGEQKFGVPCDSPESERLYRLAEQYNVPVLLHFQHAKYNLGIERFGKVLEKFPKVNFIGH